ncbi:MAG: outer membrane beta-barrel protein [Chthoniobacterales bacterium]
MKKYIVTSLVAAVAVASAIAGPSKVVKEVIVPEDPCLFRDQEFQIDAFGLGYFNQGGNSFNYYNNSNAAGISGRPAWGGGLGINYFFSRYIGIGLEQDLYGRQSGNSPVDAGYTRWATIGNLFLRYPICSWNLAPYIMIGGGANYGNTPKADFDGQALGIPPNRRGTYNSGQGFGHVGGGVEYRFTKNIGIFSDARYIYSGVAGLANDNLMWRYGLRFAF